LPSQSSGLVPCFHLLESNILKASSILSGLVPTKTLVPISQVYGRSVESQSVIQGTFITVVSSVIPPESVKIEKAFLTR